MAYTLTKNGNYYCTCIDREALLQVIDNLREKGKSWELYKSSNKNRTVIMIDSDLYYAETMLTKDSESDRVISEQQLFF